MVQTHDVLVHVVVDLPQLNVSCFSLYSTNGCVFAVDCSTISAHGFYVD